MANILRWILITLVGILAVISGISEVHGSIIFLAGYAIGVLIGYFAERHDSSEQPKAVKP